MIEWFKKAWEKIGLFATSDSFIVVLDTTNKYVRMAGAVFTAVLGMVFALYPTLNQSWAEPLADQMFRLATQLWNGA